MRRRPFLRSLGGRIVALFLGLLLAVQALSLWRTHGEVQHNARQQLRADLVRSAQVLEQLLLQRGELLAAATQTLGGDYGLRTVVEDLARADAAERPLHAGTVRSLLDDKLADGRLHGATLLAVLDRQGGLVAAVGPLAPTLTGPQAATWTPGSAQLTLLAGQPHQAVRVLIGQRGALPQGWLVALAPVAAMLPELARLSQSALTLVDAHGRPLASTLGAAPARLQPLAELKDDTGEALLDGTEWALRQLALPTTAGGSVRLVLARSVSEAIEPFRGLQAQLLGVSALAVVLFALGSLLMARRVTAPVQGLVEAARRLGRGDHDTPLPPPRRDDELGELAQAFEGMRAQVAERTQHIQRLAFTDTLTGLPNRARFEDELSRRLQAGAPLAVLLLNLDRMERINQALGRSAGDTVLRLAAQRLQSQLAAQPEAPDALVARLGGDEFGVLLPGAGLARAQEVARLLGRAFTEHPLSLDDSLVDLSAAFGIALAPTHAEQPEALLGRALLALGEAKRRMADLMVYDPAQDAGSAQTLSLLGELRRALRQHELRLYLQPKLSLATGEVCGAEALVRWQHPERGLVPPVQFIPFAEETGFIHELTLWVVEEAARHAALLREHGVALKLSVNLSAHDLMKPDLLPRLQRALRSQDLPPQALCLEITESAIAHDPARALQTLAAMKAAGFSLSIDDFGAGQTSLAQLIGLPVDELKLDMLFVRAMDQDPQKASMVGSLIRLGHDRGLSVVAEGVENAAILALLRGLGCDQAQGWHIGKPMPAGELASWVQARRVLAAVRG